MKYLFLMYGTEGAWNDEERRECMIESLAICDELAAKGKFLSTSPLQSVTTASTVRVRDGQTLITDGPFAETREQLGGYFAFELDDLDEAIAVATKLPPIRKGATEIRPMYTPEGLPPSRPISFKSKSTPYILLSYDDEAAWEKAGPEARQKALAKAIGLAHRLHESGKYLSCSPLHPSATATCVRIRNGKREITDGPFTETHEVLGGFYLILADTVEEAQLVAAEHSKLSNSPVEVRPLFDYSVLR